MRVKKFAYFELQGKRDQAERSAGFFAGSQRRGRRPADARVPRENPVRGLLDRLERDQPGGGGILAPADQSNEYRADHGNGDCQCACR